MSSNDHGWVRINGIRINDHDASNLAFAPCIPDRQRCGCTRTICQRPATQEDLLCDECRETC